MGAKHLSRENLMHFADRLRALTPETPPKWGAMSAPKMVCHLHQALDITLERFTPPDQSNLFFRMVMRPLLVHVIPFPKGAKAPPDFTPDPDGDLTAEREALFMAIDDFFEVLESQPDKRVRNPFFGMLTLKNWSKFQGKHMDHHLRQFGV